MSDLQGKVALVTGASRGIGAAIAKRLAAEGAAVAITYERSADRAAAVVREIEAAGGRAEAFALDAADPAAGESAVERAVQAFGRLDVFVANAGVIDYGPLENLTSEDFERTMAINLRAVFFGAQAAARRMQAGGRIVAIGSNLAEHVPLTGVALYAMSKAALVGLVKGAARDLGPRGITVNVVQPGPVDTDMNPADGDLANTVRGLTALGRYAAGEEIASLVAYLASGQAGFVTGAALTIDGGMAA